MSDWQPIETAYTYENVGKRIMITNVSGQIIDAMMLSGSLMTSMDKPTHWMPLPKSPPEKTWRPLYDSLIAKRALAKLTR